MVEPYFASIDQQTMSVVPLISVSPGQNVGRVADETYCIFMVGTGSSGDAYCPYSGDHKCFYKRPGRSEAAISKCSFPEKMSLEETALSCADYLLNNSQ